MEKYDDSNMKTLTAIEIIKANPKMYWGEENLTYKVVNTSILRQLKESGFNNIAVSEFSDWYIVVADENWLCSPTRNVDEFFKAAIWLDGGGGNGFRFEYFLNVVSSDVCFFENDNLHEIKGKIDRSLILELKKNFSGKTCLAYKLLEN